MAHSDDHDKSAPAAGKVPTDPAVDNEEVHSSATLDFDQLTTSNTGIPKLVPPPPSADAITHISSNHDEGVPTRSPFEEPASSPMERVTFSNLEALVPERVAAPPPEEPVAKPVERRTTIHDIKPPSARRFFGVFAGALVLGAVLFFGMRIEWDFGLVQSDPGLAMNVALGLQPKPQPVVPKPKAVVRTESITGELRALDVTLERAGPGSNKGALILRGRLENATNRIQSKVMLRASLVTADGLALESKRGFCCTMEDAPKKEMQEKEQISLKPGDVKYFSFVFKRKGRRPANIKPKVEIAFSEAERIR
mgnify:CR=1 FL=1